MATTVIMNPLSEQAGENSFQENRDSRGTWGAEKPESTEWMEVGSYHGNQKG